MSAAPIPNTALPDTRPLRLCGYCNTWNSRPCGEQCGFSLNDPTFEMIEKKALGNDAKALRS